MGAGQGPCSKRLLMGGGGAKCPLPDGFGNFISLLLLRHRHLIRMRYFLLFFGIFISKNDYSHAALRK